MSWSLALRNGDLALGGSSLGVVTDGAKLVQDLRCAILEPMGNDDAHPDFGSLLDGGVDRTGRHIPSVIGSDNWSLVRMAIESELNRIVFQYQSTQLSRAQDDQMTYGKQTLTPGETLVDIADMHLIQMQDKMLVTITLNTLFGDIPINVPISAEGVLTI